MATATGDGCKQNGEKPVRVWVDGCFDIVHFGHANALRQAKLMGDQLVVGIHSDEDISEHKGPPVFTLEERCKIVRSIKWVDEVVPGSTYLPGPHTLDENNCDFCAHGDDYSIMADGEDAYRLLKASGRYKEFRRTEGVSTTDLVGRMLLATKAHHTREDASLDKDTATNLASDHAAKSPFTGGSQFLASTQRMQQFASSREPTPDDVVVYVDGDYDLFHVGHVSFLEKCSQLGTYVIVGIHTDQEVNRHKGSNYPIMNLFERTLNVLACRYVSNVIMGAPYRVSQQLLTDFNVNLVVHGSTVVKNCKDTPPQGFTTNDPYEIPKKMGIFKEVESESDLTTTIIIQRIIDHRLTYEARNKKKEQKELTHIEANTT